jgi:hypothetical protein
MLEGLTDLLVTTTPDQYEAPDDTAPRGAHLVGVATNNQKALKTLILWSHREHIALHHLQGLPFGLNKNVSADHRFLHVAIDVLEELLDEDVTQTFPDLKGSYMIDRHWNVYWIDMRLLARIRRSIRI